MKKVEQIVFPILEGLFIVLFYLLFCTYDFSESEFHPEELRRADVWITAVMLSFACTYIMGMIKNRILGYERQRHNGRIPALYAVLKTNSLRVDKIHIENREGELSEAVAKWNKKSYDMECDRRLHRINDTLDSAVVFGKVDEIRSADCEKSAEEVAEEAFSYIADKYFIIEKRKRKRFRKLLDAVISGDIHSKKITAAELQERGEADDPKARTLKNESGRIEVATRVRKFFSTMLFFIATTVLFAHIVFSFNIEIITQYALYLLFSVTSGITFGGRMVYYTRSLYTARNDFFAEYMHIYDEWTPKKIIAEEQSEAKGEIYGS